MRTAGFTLAELLIALVILGMIATFTIPKVLQSQQSAASKANAKEVAGMISGAYQAYRNGNTPISSTKPSDLMPYMNYVRVETGGFDIDSHPTQAQRTCNATRPCVLLHNGGMLMFLDISPFGGTTDMHIMEFGFDPDAVYSGSAVDSAGKTVQFTLYFNGFLTTRGKLKPNSCNGGGCTIQPNASFDPTWFDWN